MTSYIKRPASISPPGLLMYTVMASVSLRLLRYAAVMAKSKALSWVISPRMQRVRLSQLKVSNEMTSTPLAVSSFLQRTKGDCVGMRCDSPFYPCPAVLACRFVSFSTLAHTGEDALRDTPVRGSSVGVAAIQFSKSIVRRTHCSSAWPAGHPGDKKTSDQTTPANFKKHL